MVASFHPARRPRPGPSSPPRPWGRARRERTSISSAIRSSFLRTIPFAILLALIVGISFNLMPCVLPVVPLKAIGFFEVSRHNRARCLMLGFIFSLGVLAVFAALSVPIIALRQSFHFSWGEQFAYGWFVWPIVAILVVMAMGMFGLFDVMLPSAVYNLTPSHESAWGNFLFGILTAVLSTPCTAPMFAGLLAWAALEPVYLGVLIMMTVGVGMVPPYLVLSAFPGLASRVPRTGPWSALLKQMMGFLVLGVAVYFAGGRLASGREFIWAVFLVIAVAMIFLVIRTMQLVHRVGPVVLSLVSAAAVISISLWVTLRLTGGELDGNDQRVLHWQPFTPAALTAARSSRKPVLVEFTANWCGNCLALEASVFRDPRTAAAVAKNDVLLLRADLTSSDAAGWDMVNQLNPGGGIPLTAIYPPGADQPIKLTSLYTTENLLGASGRSSSDKG